MGFLAAVKHQYHTDDETRPEERFVVRDSRNVAVAVEVVGNARLESRLKFVLSAMSTKESIYVYAVLYTIL